MAVLGADACRAGWIGAVFDGSSYAVLVAASFAELLEAANAQTDLEAVGVDIPIGLPDDAPRLADLLARQRLPAGRKSSVFPAPARVATEFDTHLEASAANREATGGVGLSIQAFSLVPRILEVDRLVRSGATVGVYEAHPEVCFAEIDPACVVPSKRTPEGRAARTAALTSVGLEPPAYRPRQGYAPDDLLDACAVAWTARRCADGLATCLPDPPEAFSDGPSAAIWV